MSKLLFLVSALATLGSALPALASPITLSNARDPVANTGQFRLGGPDADGLAVFQLAARVGADPYAATVEVPYSAGGLQSFTANSYIACDPGRGLWSGLSGVVSSSEDLGRSSKSGKEQS
jgi:hypothetical protein